MRKTILTLYYRLYQASFKLAMPLLPWRKPVVLEGAGCVKNVPDLLQQLKIKNVLIVTDSTLMKLGLLDNLITELGVNGCQYAVFDKTVPDPTIENVEEALKMYHQYNCKAIIAFGGGSPMDCAKAVGARVSRPNKPVGKMKGVLKVIFKIPTLIAVPTTAGTGSEVTLAAVISNSETHEKYPINDFCLIPHYAVLDPELTLKLPPHITAATGMDAMTHAVESYIGRSNTKETRKAALEAITLIHQNLLQAYNSPGDLKARAAMLKGSYLAGVAFTRAYVGYVHAIAHTIGGFYGYPHGQANAIIMPHVLEFYGNAASNRLAELADHIGIANGNLTNAQKANAFVLYLKDMNKKMGIQSNIPEIEESDLPEMISRALAEANPLYPVPKILFREDLKKLYLKIKGK
ncbi:iron-containing alcohol dehydrogenase [Aquiflexum gelatinilyticum]|uniref:Iron-containing alcohol dehydrogenase n=1 Tax=Aquiflexum gelatinilyticum TaxID=2961943 RepID=A0A9X2T1E5_9BACT|nr:iron-containing alcohol dehydrogenase [Aquiflexum gelatinilyticum]MCR9015846.1 iron-containing alcohol dehydrogenase [Aquiflexum gelatinilyticum]